MGMPPSRAPRSASSIAARRNSSVMIGARRRRFAAVPSGASLQRPPLRSRFAVRSVPGAVRRGSYRVCMARPKSAMQPVTTENVPYFCSERRYADSASMSAADRCEVLPCVSLITWVWAARARPRDDLAIRAGLDRAAEEP